MQEKTPGEIDFQNILREIGIHNAKLILPRPEIEVWHTDYSTRDNDNGTKFKSVSIRINFVESTPPTS